MSIVLDQLRAKMKPCGFVLGARRLLSSPSLTNSPRSTLAVYFDSSLSPGVRTINEKPLRRQPPCGCHLVWRCVEGHASPSLVCSCPTIQLPTVSSSTPHRPPHCVMTTPELWAVGDTPPNVDHQPAIAAVLNSEIKTLTIFKDTIESTPVKAVFESVIMILTLVRVRLLVLFRFCTLLLVARPGRGKGRSVRGTGERLCPNVPCVGDRG